MIVSPINEPFGTGRDPATLLFDFAIVLSCLKNVGNHNVLDFAGGSGWITEFLNRAGYHVTMFDIDPGCVDCMYKRIDVDARLDRSRIRVEVCDAHHLKFCADEFFGNIICYDSLHHMSDFGLVLKEMYRILQPGGRASFSEPGSKHADAEETKAFLKKYKADDPDWIERSIIIEEINDIASQVGFEEMRIKPFLLPRLVDYSLSEWLSFAKDDMMIQDYMARFTAFNYESRVIFYLDKPF